MRLVYLFLLGVGVALFLLIRQWMDRKKEKRLDIEIARDGEEHLGIWANKSATAFIKFRLHRDQTFSYDLVEYPGNDTVHINGKYDIIGAGNGRSTAYYPRLIAVNEKNDTLMNYFIAYITPYDTKIDKVDRMVLNAQGIYDTIGYTFFRIKQ